MNEAFRKMVVADYDGRISDVERGILDLRTAEWEEALSTLIAEHYQKECEILNAANIEAERWYSLRFPEATIQTMLSEAEAKAGRIRSGRLRAERRLAEVQRRNMLKDGRTAAMAEFFRSAIQRHRDLTNDPNDIDNALYAALEGHWCFETGETV